MSTPRLPRDLGQALDDAGRELVDARRERDGARAAAWGRRTDARLAHLAQAEERVQEAEVLHRMLQAEYARSLPAAA